MATIYARLLEKQGFDDLMDFLTKTRIRYQMLVSDADSSDLDD